MTIENVQMKIKSLDGLSNLFNDISSNYDTRLCLDDLVKTDDYGFIESVDNDLASEIYILINSLHRMSLAIELYSDKLVSTMFCFELFVNSDKYVR